MSRSRRRFLAAALLISALSLPIPNISIAQARKRQAQLVLPTPGRVRNARPARLVGRATVNFGNLAHKPSGARPAVRPWSLSEEMEDPAEPISALSPGTTQGQAPTFAASPQISTSFMGLDDIPMVDSSYVVVPPDVSGAVGLLKAMAAHNNNYRIFEKSDGTVVSTVGTATFWAPSGETALNRLADPRVLYDPYNDRWISVMFTFGAGGGNILVGVSQTSDPNGDWYLYRFSTGYAVDFPIVGFNKNWIVVTINRYGAFGFQAGLTLVLNYPLARAGTGSGTMFTQAVDTHFNSAPCVTYSPTSDTLYIVTHLSSPGATYALDTITGTASAPVYTAGGAQTRPGGGWVQPEDQRLPQSAPNSGTSACGAPCLIETQDSSVRSAPVYRDGFIYYTQTVGLPSTFLGHTGVQWTKLNTPDGSFADGGRIEDPTATSTNGGKWYAYPHIAVNSAGDFMIGFSQFSSAQHPSAGYCMHFADDAPGTIRAPEIFKAGEDYYHKDFGSGRNRWGDFSQAQVDPSDDRSLWTVQEYAKWRVSTNDGTARDNGSRWGTYWANVAGPAPTVTIAPGPRQNEGQGGLTTFSFAVNLSTGYGMPVTVSYETSDGTATIAGNDYQAAVGSILIPAGATGGTITVNVVGDTNGEPDETFNVTLTSAINAGIVSPRTSIGTIVNDDNRAPTITVPANLTRSEGQAMSITATATDVDAGDAIAMTQTGKPASLAFMATNGNPASATIAGTLGFLDGNGNPPIYTIAWTATDSGAGNLSASGTTVLTVTDVNRNPVSQPGGPYAGIVGLPLSFSGNTSFDPDGDALTYEWDFDASDGITVESAAQFPAHAYVSGTGSPFTVTLKVTDPLGASDTATTLANVSDVVSADCFEAGGNKAIRLESGKPLWCAQVQPSAGSYSNNDVILGTIRLTLGTSSIVAAPGKTVVATDRNEDGVEEITACFVKSDLRTLFSGAPNGRSTQTVMISGDLSTGGRFECTMAVDVVKSGGTLSATISPNPLNPVATLIFRTTRVGFARVRVYDLAGRLVQSLVDQSNLAPGYHEVDIRGRRAGGEELPSGVYFYRIEAAEGITSGRFTILR